MIRWWEHSGKGGTDGQTDGETDNTICRAAWSQLKTYRLKTFADLRRRWRSCVTRIGHTAAADAPVDSCIQLSHLYASVPPVSFCCSWISWSSRNFRQRSWLHCGSYWPIQILVYHAILYNGGSYLFMLGLKLTHVSIMGPCWLLQLLSSNCMVKRLTLIYMDNLSGFLCGVHKIGRLKFIFFIFLEMGVVQTEIKIHELNRLSLSLKPNQM